MNMGFWLRWSARDLRARWMQVLAVALIIAFGASVYAGLGGQGSWRKASYDRSYSTLNMYDVQLELADGSFMPVEDLQKVVAGIEGIEGVSLRLLTPALIDASDGEHTILVQGEIVGVEVDDTLPYATPVNSLMLAEDADLEIGRNLTQADSGQPVAVMEYKFARFHQLDAGHILRLSGNIPIELVGMVYSPEYFQVISGEVSAAFGNDGSYAVLFMPLATVQNLTEREGLINNAVLTVAEGVDPQQVADALKTALAEQYPEIGATFTFGTDDSVRSTLYTDAEADQATWNLFGFIFLIGAAFGTFNLAGRMVESQRRQIGIGMALGVPRFWIAFRPMLVGVQIAVLGTGFGLIIGYGISQLFGSFMKDIFPMPFYEFDFYLIGFIRAMVIGITLPLIATLIPVWRAVRVAPIDAIKSGHLVAKGGGLTGLIKWIPLPLGSFTQMPLKNILRAPWRTFLTMSGVGLAMVMLVMFSGFLDSFRATIDQGNTALTYQGQGRIMVTLDFFYPTDSERVTQITQLPRVDGSPMFTQADANLIIGSTLIGKDENIETLIELVDMNDSPIWQPNLLAGDPTLGGIILSQKMAEDLGVWVGDSITLEHPKREGLLAFQLVKTEIPVVGIHDSPVRAFSYMNLADASLMGLDGLTDYIVVKPAEGVEIEEVRRGLFNQAGVTSVQGVEEITESFDNLLKIFTDFLRVVQVVVVIMAFLIAFNSTSINVDERVREIATMFAFGLPIRVVTRMQMIENFIIGLFGTLMGIVLGQILLEILMQSRVNEQIKDIKLIVEVAPATWVYVLFLGVITVTLTPLISVRRMFRMDIPSTLRVME